MEYLELTKEEEKDYIQQLYHAFATGRDFELFLNYFLKRIGFQEVVTTKYVKDNGIDLTCTKPGIDPQGLVLWIIMFKLRGINQNITCKRTRFVILSELQNEINKEMY